MSLQSWKIMTLTLTPQSIVGSNELHDSPMEPSSTQYIWSKVYRHFWSWQQLQTLAGKLTSLYRQGSLRLWCTKRYILYKRNVFWTNMCFWNKTIISLVCLKRTSGQKIIVKNAYMNSNRWYYWFVWQLFFGKRSEVLE
jgi:hypothetical protein